MRLRFVDKLISLDVERSVVVAKAVTFEEAMLVRPGRGRGVPSTLVLEWVGQAAAILVAESTAYAFFPVVGSFEVCEFGERPLAGDVARIDVSVRSWHQTAARLDALVTTPDGRRALNLVGATCAFLPLERFVVADELRAAVAAARGEFPGPVFAARESDEGR